MLTKESKWTISHYVDGSRVTVTRDSVEDVFAFLHKEADKPDFDKTDYLIYPPNANLTAMELIHYGLPPRLSNLLIPKYLN